MPKFEGARLPPKPRTPESHAAEIGRSKIYTESKPVLSPEAKAESKRRKEEEERAKAGGLSIDEALKRRKAEADIEHAAALGEIPEVSVKQLESTMGIDKMDAEERAQKTRAATEAAMARFEEEAAKRKTNLTSPTEAAGQAFKAAAEDRDAKKLREEENERTANILGRERAVEMWDTATNAFGLNADKAREYVVAVGKIRDRNEPEKLKKLNAAFGLPETYDPLTGSGKSRPTAMRSLGMARGRAEALAASERVTGMPGRAEGTPRFERMKKTIPVAEAAPVKNEIRKAEAASTFPELNTRNIAEWEQNLLTTRDELHDDIAELSKRRTPENQKALEQKYALIKETELQLERVTGELHRREGMEDRAHRWEYAKHLGTEEAEQAMSYEERLRELTKRMGSLGRKIKKSYGKSPEEIASTGGLGTQVKEFFAHAAGKETDLDAWKTLNADYLRISELLDAYQSRYRPGTGEISPVRIPSRKELEIGEKVREETELMEVPEGMTEEEYEKSFGLPSEIARLKKQEEEELPAIRPTPRVERPKPIDQLVERENKAIAEYRERLNGIDEELAKRLEREDANPYTAYRLAELDVKSLRDKHVLYKYGGILETYPKVKALVDELNTLVESYARQAEAERTPKQPSRVGVAKEILSRPYRKTRTEKPAPETVREEAPPTIETPAQRHGDKIQRVEKVRPPTDAEVKSRTLLEFQKTLDNPLVGKQADQALQYLLDDFDTRASADWPSEEYPSWDQRHFAAAAAVLRKAIADRDVRLAAEVIREARLKPRVRVREAAPYQIPKEPTAKYPERNRPPTPEEQQALAKSLSEWKKSKDPEEKQLYKWMLHNIGEAVAGHWNERVQGFFKERGYRGWKPKHFKEALQLQESMESIEADLARRLQPRTEQPPTADDIRDRLKIIRETGYVTVGHFRDELKTYIEALENGEKPKKLTPEFTRILEQSYRGWRAEDFRELLEKLKPPEKKKPAQKKGKKMPEAAE